MGASIVSTDVAIPNPANIAVGGATANNTAAAQTILTIPAGRTWHGSLALVMTNAATTGTTVSATIQTAGTGVVPAAGKSLLSVQPGTVGTVAGLASIANNISNVFVVAPAGNSVTLTLNNSTATTCTSMATAVGVLL